MSTEETTDVLIKKEPGLTITTTSTSSPTITTISITPSTISPIVTTATTIIPVQTTNPVTTTNSNLTIAKVVTAGQLIVKEQITNQTTTSVTTTKTIASTTPIITSNNSNITSNNNVAQLFIKKTDSLQPSSLSLPSTTSSIVNQTPTIAISFAPINKPAPILVNTVPLTTTITTVTTASPVVINTNNTTTNSNSTSINNNNTTTPSSNAVPQTSTTIQTNGETNSTESTSKDKTSPVVLNKQRLQDLVAEIDKNEQLDEDVEDVLLNIADEFIDNLVSNACLVAKHRKSKNVEVKDVQLILEKNYNMYIPGFGSLPLNEEFKNVYKKSPATEAHKQRMALIKKTLKKF